MEPLLEDGLDGFHNAPSMGPVAEATWPVRLASQRAADPAVALGEQAEDQTPPERNQHILKCNEQRLCG